MEARPCFMGPLVLTQRPLSFESAPWTFVTISSFDFKNLGAWGGGVSKCLKTINWPFVQSFKGKDKGCLLHTCFLKNTFSESELFGHLQYRRCGQPCRARRSRLPAFAPSGGRGAPPPCLRKVRDIPERLCSYPTFLGQPTGLVSLDQCSGGKGVFAACSFPGEMHFLIYLVQSKNYLSSLPVITAMK